jgi:tetratricopeptide (TPR) repeat protein
MTGVLALVLCLAAQTKKPPPPPPAPPSPVEIDRMMASASEKLFKGDFAGGLVEFNRVLQIDPKNPRAISHRGLCQSGLKQYDKALKDFAAALDLDPRHSFSFLGRGDIHFARREYEEAIKDYTKVLEINPLQPAAHALRGLSWIQKSSYLQAREDLDRAIGFLAQATDAAGLYLRGASKHWAHDWDGAEADLTRAVDLSPRHQQALLTRGRNRILTGKLRDAQSDLRRAVELDPKDGLAGLLLGDAYFLDSQWPEALGAWRKALEGDPSVEDEARLRLWRARALSGEQEAAVQELEDWAKRRKPPLEEGDVQRTKDFFVGRLTQEAFLADVAAGDDRRLLERRCARLTDAGLLRLLAKDAPGAEALFRRALETRVQEQIPYAVAASKLPRK